MKPKNEVKHLRGYIETIEKKYRELESINAALVEALNNMIEFVEMGDSLSRLDTLSQAREAIRKAKENNDGAEQKEK